MVHKLRAGVVGLGHLGRHHARIYAELPGVELVALCDRQPAARDALPPELAAVPFCTDPAELAGRVDLLSIVTPTSTHLEVARPFVELGHAVLVEKPIAASVEEARELVAAAAKSGALLQVGHVEAFNPVVAACGALVRRPRFVEVHRMGNFSGRGLDVDVVRDLMIHDLDLLLEWIDAEPVLVHAVGVPVLSAQVDLASVRLEFADGAVASLTASRVSLRPQRRMRLFMPERYVRLDFLERSVECVERSLEPDGSASIQAVPVEVLPGEPLRAELESFVSAVRAGSEPRVSGARALRALELAAAIREHMDRRAALWPA